MRKVKTLNEELKRMQTLMGYKNGSSLVETVVFEQQVDGDDNKDTKCITITHKGAFGVEETAGSGSFTDFLTKIKTEISSNPKLKEKMEKGVVYVTKLTLKGGASNYHSSNSVVPDLNNDGNTPYNGKKTYTKDKKSSNYKLNKQLAVDRAKNLATRLGEKGGLDTINVVYDEGALDNALNNVKGYVVDTGGTNDKSKTKWTANGITYEPGQFVEVSMTICYDSQKKSQDCSCINPTTKEEVIYKCDDYPDGEKPEACKVKEPEPDPVLTGKTEIILTGKTLEVVKECFNKTRIELNFDGNSSHNCNHAIYEVYANGYNLKRKTNKGDVVDYASLNNQGIMDNATEKDGRLRFNHFFLEIDGLNGDFFNEDVVGRHNGKLIISAACKRTIKKNGRALKAWSSSSDCHEGVGTIKVILPSLRKDEDVSVDTPNTFDDVVELAEFAACENIVTKIKEGKPKIMQRIKIWWQNLKKKRKEGS